MMYFSKKLRKKQEDEANALQFLGEQLYEMAPTLHDGRVVRCNVCYHNTTDFYSGLDYVCDGCIKDGECLNVYHGINQSDDWADYTIAWLNRHLVGMQKVALTVAALVILAAPSHAWTAPGKADQLLYNTDGQKVIRLAFNPPLRKGQQVYRLNVPPKRNIFKRIFSAGPRFGLVPRAYAPVPKGH